MKTKHKAWAMAGRVQQVRAHGRSDDDVAVLRNGLRPGGFMNPRPAWITPREEPETIEFHREVPLWELGEIAEEITDADYRKGIYWQLGGIWDE